MGRSIFVILGLLPVALSLSETRADDCPLDWSRSDQSCYRFFNQRKTWFEAERTCRQEGGHLASINTQEDLTALSSMIPMGLFQNVWSGLRDPQKEHRWEWSDGSKFRSELWSQEQLDKLGKCNGCVELWGLFGHLQWKDADCESKRSFICQFQPKVFEGIP